nr:hypothetical protein [uncultured Psychroserpens sp.]
MKTKILKLSCFAILLFAFFGCNDCSECETQLKNIEQELVDLKKESSKSKSIKSSSIMKEDEGSKSLRTTYLARGKYDVFGDFSVDDDRITLFIPVTVKNLTIRNVENITTNNINAILVRVDNNISSSTPESPIVEVIEGTYKISSLNLNKEKLKLHKKLKVIVLHDNATDLSNHINGYKDCLKTQTGYVKENCPSKPKFAPPRPNEDGGDIIVGG